MYQIINFISDQAPAAIQEKIQQLENENKNLTSSLNQMQQAQQQIQSSQTHTENQNRSYLKQIEELQANIFVLILFFYLLFILLNSIILYNK